MDWIWIPLTIPAAGVQTLRNTAHRLVAGRLSLTAGATVRFIFALPFALGCLVATLLANGGEAPAIGRVFPLWVVAGCSTQMLGTVLMLLALRKRSLVVTIALTKTEPLQVAVLSLLVLGEGTSAVTLAAAGLAVVGVMLLMLPEGRREFDRSIRVSAMLGLAAGGFFGLSAVLFRGAMLSLGDASFFIKAAVTLASALTVQTVAAVAWLALHEPRSLTAMARAWQACLVTGLFGAAASQLWFGAYALQSATLVSAIGLVEVLFARLASHRVFAEPVSRLERVGILSLIASALMIFLLGDVRRS